MTATAIGTTGIPLSVLDEVSVSAGATLEVVGNAVRVDKALTTAEGVVASVDEINVLIGIGVLA